MGREGVVVEVDKDGGGGAEGAGRGGGEGGSQSAGTLERVERSLLSYQQMNTSIPFFYRFLYGRFYAVFVLQISRVISISIVICL